MVSQNHPQKPTNLRPYNCDLSIHGQHFTKLEISPYYEKHNKELLESLEKREIELPVEELAKKLITDKLICQLVKELNNKEVKLESRYYHWAYYSFRVYREDGRAYKLVWCVAEDEPQIIGLMDCYRQSRFDKEN